MIRVERLTKRYGRTTAIEGLSFEVLPGRVTGFLGPNGAGKSTTMRVLMGLDRPNSGLALMNGQPYHELRWPLREVGALLEPGAFHSGRSAAHHLEGFAHANAIGPARVEEVLAIVGLASVATRRAGTFSTGMAQRLGIAAALLGDPLTLLFDEPINGLDPEGIRWFRQLARDLAAEGRTVFLSSHLISEMALTADHLVVIGRGHLVAESSMAELAARGPSTVRVRTREPERLAAILREERMSVTQRSDGALSIAGGRADVIADRAATARIAISELSPEQASLEDVFMELTNGNVEYRADETGSAGASVGSADRRRS
jgi:ABC-2 type transport system ATP-binding protein